MDLGHTFAKEGEILESVFESIPCSNAKSEMVKIDTSKYLIDYLNALGNGIGIQTL